MHKVKIKYDKRETVDFSTYMDPHLPACTLKMFLRELPESVFLSTLLPQFSQLMVNNVDQRSDLLKGLIYQLPAVNQRVIHEVFALFRIIAAYQNINRMNERNLSIIFVPAFSIGADLFTLLLHEQDKLFSGTTIAGAHPEYKNISQQNNKGCNSLSEIPPILPNTQMTPSTSSTDEFDHPKTAAAPFCEPNIGNTSDTIHLACLHTSPPDLSTGVRNIGEEGECESEHVVTVSNDTKVVPMVHLSVRKKFIITGEQEKKATLHVAKPDE